MNQRSRKPGGGEDSEEAEGDSEESDVDAEPGAEEVYTEDLRTVVFLYEEDEAKNGRGRNRDFR